MIRSKSTYVSYLRCNWLPHYRAIYNLKSQDTVFSTLGQVVDKLAQDKTCEDLFELIDEAEDHKIKEVIDEAYKQFPGAAMGVEYDEDFSWETGIERTNSLIADKSIKVIFQACFIRDGWGCIVDILIRLNDGSWLALEVKSFLITNACKKLSQGVSGSITNSGTWLDDIAIQYWIASATIKVKFRLQCINDKYELDNGEKYFSTTIVEHPKWLDGYFESGKFDLDRAVREKFETLDLYLSTLANGDKIHKCNSISSCKRCDFVEVCRGPKIGPDAWAGWLPNAFDLRDKKMSECVEGNVTKFHQFLQWRQLRADRENREIREPFKALTNDYPINPSDRLIDFEAVIHPFPYWLKQTPWQPMPFMFSWGMPYYESGWEGNGKPTVVLAQDPKDDPRLYLIDALIKLECPGRLFHWGAFDKVIMERLIAYEQDPARKEKLMILLHKMVDACAITKNNIAFPGVRGYSIKQVGPYCSGIPYTDDTNGMQVGIDWLNGKSSEAIEYCRLDNIQESCTVRKTLSCNEFGQVAKNNVLAKYSHYYEILCDTDAIARGWGVSTAEVLRQCCKGDNASKFMEEVVANRYGYSRPPNQNDEFDGYDEYGVTISVRSLTKQGAKIQASSKIGTGRKCGKYDLLTTLTKTTILIFVDIIDFPVVRIIPVYCKDLLPNGNLSSLKTNYKRDYKGKKGQKTSGPFLRHILRRTYEQIEWSKFTSEQLHSRTL